MSHPPFGFEQVWIGLDALSWRIPMFTVIPLPTLTTDDLMTRGYFPDRVIRHQFVISISAAIRDIFNL